MRVRAIALAVTVVGCCADVSCRRAAPESLAITQIGQIRGSDGRRGAVRTNIAAVVTHHDLSNHVLFGRIPPSHCDSQYRFCSPRITRSSERAQFDLILMDVQMPEWDGLEATAAIRAQETTGGHIPIIALTAHAMSEDRERCLAAGMDGYVSKPVSVETLLAEVARCTDIAALSRLHSNVSESYRREPHHAPKQ